MLPLQHLTPELLFFLFVGALAVALLIKRPGAGLLLLIALTPVESILRLTFEYSKAGKLILTGFTAGVYFLSYAAMPHRPIRYPYLWAQLLFSVSAITATLASIVPAESALGVLQLLVIFSLCYLIAISPLTIETSATMLRLVAWSAGIIAPLAILQMLFGFEGYLGSVEQQADAAAGVYDLGNGLFRSAATFNGSNSAAAFFGGAFVVALLHSRAFPETRRLYSALAALVGAALISTFSRGAFLGTFAAVCLLLPTRRPLVKWTVIGALVAGVGLIFLFPPAGLSVVTRPSQGTLSRLAAWREALDIIKDQWVTGIGIYGFKPYVELNFPDPNVSRQPHNGVLKAIVEQGVLGGVAYFVMAYQFARTCYRSMHEEAYSKGEPHLTPRWFVMASIAGVGACFFLQELFDAGFVTGGSSLAVLLAVLLGVQCRHLRLETGFAPRRAPVLSLASRARARAIQT
jgi:O-antigen ligase